MSARKYARAITEARPFAAELVDDLHDPDLTYDEAVSLVAELMVGVRDGALEQAACVCDSNGERASAAEIRSRKSGRKPNADHAAPDAASYDVGAKDPNWKGGTP